MICHTIILLPDRLCRYCQDTLFFTLDYFQSKDGIKQINLPVTIHVTICFKQFREGLLICPDIGYPIGTIGIINLRKKDFALWTGKLPLQTVGVRLDIMNIYKC